MTTESLLSGISNEFKNIDTVREKLFNAQLVQLHPNIEGFESPQSYGVYKGIGGSPLGVVGNTYKPMDLNVMLDSIVNSALECGGDLDLSTLDFKEYKGGSKVAFTLDLPTKEIKHSPMVGDIISRKIEFRTGFDGKTKSSVTESFNRIWCANGCTNTKSQSLSFKNTTNNHIKIYNLCNHITSAIENSDNFVTNIGKLADINFNQKELDAFITRVTGYDVAMYKELSTRARNTLDMINSQIAIESQNTGNNLFSVVNGITRYTTHSVAKGSEEKLFYSSANALNSKALELAFSELN